MFMKNPSQARHTFKFPSRSCLGYTKNKAHYFYKKNSGRLSIAFTADGGEHCHAPYQYGRWRGGQKKNIFS